MPGPFGVRRSYRAVRRVAPLILAAYRHWDQLSPKEKERYRQQARHYAERGAGYARGAASKLPRSGRSRKP
jgi:hypothetical protein